MICAHIGKLFKASVLLVTLLVALPVMALDNNRPVNWKVTGIITGPASPFTTAAYFPRPLVAGELVEMTFKVNPGTVGTIWATYAAYENAIVKVKVSGSDWSIPMRAPLGRGLISVSNDDVNNGDALSLSANTPILAGKTWFQVTVDLNNPGGPHPGPGPWTPFTSLALPKVPPALGYFPNTNFYIVARRDVGGQPADGGAYFGQVLSITAERSDD